MGRGNVNQKIPLGEKSLADFVQRGFLTSELKLNHVTDHRIKVIATDAIKTITIRERII
jgi:hypothetical protein